MLASELGEFVNIPSASIEEGESYRWTHADTLIFLDLYETYRKAVGTVRLKSFKKMYEEISKEIKRKTGKNISPTNCENRWRVLERAYKKYIADSNKTGAAREFEFAEIMHNILGKKRNIHPELLVSSDTVDAMPGTSTDLGQNRAVASDDVESSNFALQVPLQPLSQKLSKKPEKKEYRSRVLKCNLLREIREDRKQYYSKRLEQADKRLEEKLKKNKLLEERNQILKDIANKTNPVIVSDLLQC